MSPASALEQLTLARRIADHASRLGVHQAQPVPRKTSHHLGAVLADSVLQAGVSYRSVVLPRIRHICRHYPETATMPALISVVTEKQVGDFLLWKHETKRSRFETIVLFLNEHGVETTEDLAIWMQRSNAPAALMSINGIGPKTVDYMGCLVGIDCIPIDRHIRTFASEAGIEETSYSQLKAVVSFAADLLGVGRRDFDAWIWEMISGRGSTSPQLALPLQSADPV